MFLTTEGYHNIFRWCFSRFWISLVLFHTPSSVLPSFIHENTLFIITTCNCFITPLSKMNVIHSHFLYQNVVSSCTLNRTRRNSLPRVNASDVKTSFQNGLCKQTFFSVTVTEQAIPFTSPRRPNSRWSLSCWVHNRSLVTESVLQVSSPSWSLVWPCCVKAAPSVLSHRRRLQTCPKPFVNDSKTSVEWFGFVILLNHHLAKILARRTFLNFCKSW